MGAWTQGQFVGGGGNLNRGNCKDGVVSEVSFVDLLAARLRKARQINKRVPRALNDPCLIFACQGLVGTTGPF